MAILGDIHGKNHEFSLISVNNLVENLVEKLVNMAINSWLSRWIIPSEYIIIIPSELYGHFQ